MKTKKGFTLVELLVVIGLLGIVVAAMVPIFLNVREKTLEKQYENVASRIETAAEKYAKETSILTVSVGKLINEGYLPADDSTDIYNPIDNTSLNCKVVEVTFENGEYVAKLTENGKYNEATNSCDAYEIKTASLINVQCYGDQRQIDACTNAFATSGFYTGNVKLNVTNPENKKIASYRWSSLTGESSTDEEMIVTTDRTKNTTYSVVIKYEDGSSENDSVTIKIDNEAPNIAKIEKSEKWSNENKNVIITASDGNGSGVLSYYIGTDASCPASGFTTSNKASLDNGSYYVCVKDKVGNISTASSFSVDKVDKKAPVCTTAAFSGTTVSDVTCTDGNNESGLDEIKYYISTSPDIPSADSAGWKNKSDLNFNPSCGTTYYLFIKATDKAGNVYISQTPVKYYESCPVYYPPSGGTSSGSSGSSSGSGNTCDWQCQMQANANAWANSNDPAEKDRLHQANVDIANKNCGGNCNYNSGNGTWTGGNGSCINCNGKK